MGNRFAQGKLAYGFCDLCGFRYLLSELKPLVIKTKQVDIRACPECWTPDQPQLQLGMYPIDDPQALRNPRPDLSLVYTSARTGAREIQWGWNPVGGSLNDTTPNNLVVQCQVGTVTVVTT